MPLERNILLKPKNNEGILAENLCYIQSVSNFQSFPWTQGSKESYKRGWEQSMLIIKSNGAEQNETEIAVGIDTQGQTDALDASHL